MPFSNIRDILDTSSEEGVNAEGEIEGEKHSTKNLRGEGDTATLSPTPTRPLGCNEICRGTGKRVKGLTWRTIDTLALQGGGEV